jgi:hypothetical protein
MSMETWQAKEGLDPDLERSKGARPAAGALGVTGQHGDGSIAATAAAAEAATGTDSNIAGTALNGAQVTSLMDVLTRVSTGQVPVETAAAAIKAAFPLLTPQQIDGMLGPLQGFTPAAVDPKTGQPVEVAGGAGAAPAVGGGEYSGMGRRQLKNNRKAIRDILGEVVNGEITRAAAKLDLLAIDVPVERADLYIDDAMADGKVDAPELAEGGDGEGEAVVESLAKSPEERLRRAAALIWESYP